MFLSQRLVRRAAVILEFVKVFSNSQQHPFVFALQIRSNALIKRGSLRLQVDGQTDALDDLSTAMNEDPENSDVYHHRGQVRGKFGQGKSIPYCDYGAVCVLLDVCGIKENKKSKHGKKISNAACSCLAPRRFQRNCG